MEKTSKQKCLEMWEWLADNPNKDKSDYYQYLRSINEENEYSYCWACKTAKRDFLGIIDCSTCPIQWLDKDKKSFCACEILGSPYLNWLDADNDINIKRINAKKTVELIKTTWEE